MADEPTTRTRTFYHDIHYDHLFDEASIGLIDGRKVKITEAEATDDGYIKITIEGPEADYYIIECHECGYEWNQTVLGPIQEVGNVKDSWCNECKERQPTEITDLIKHDDEEN